MFIKSFFFVVLGDFDNFNETETALDKELYFLILVVVTLIIMIILLNLLIAIISDAFANIMKEVEENQYLERLHLNLNYLRKLKGEKLLRFK